MPAIDEQTINEIEEKARRYDATKSETTEKVKSAITKATKDLNNIENNLLAWVEKEFCVNPFSAFLASVNSGQTLTENDVQQILSQEIPDLPFPGEAYLCSLFKQIISFKTWLEREDVKSDTVCLVPQNLKCTGVTVDAISLLWDDTESGQVYEIEVSSEASVKRIYTSSEPKFTLHDLKAYTEYRIRVRVVDPDNPDCCIWSEPLAAQTKWRFPETSGWKKCPGNVVDESKKYSVDEKNPRVAFKSDAGNSCCTIIGNTVLPSNQVTSWSIKILKSRGNDGDGIYVGVAPSDINQNEGDNSVKCGWYFDCYRSTLWSTLLQNYKIKTYGPRKGDGKYVHTGDSVGVVMDTANGDLSFVLNGVNFGVAYKGIPLDKPLVPCVILGYRGDSVELITSEVKENTVDSSIPVPSNITVNGGATWDIATFTWNAVEGASFYQIEVDGNKNWGTAAANTFTKRGFLAGTWYTFRVRAVKGNKVGKWSGVVTVRSPKESFETSGWKECPGDLALSRGYYLKWNNSRVVTKIDGNKYCTVIGNAPIPSGTVTSWKINASSNGSGIYVGVAPSDIGLNEDNNFEKCGWYFCYSGSKLFSGPPHKYSGKDYGPRGLFTTLFNGINSFFRIVVGVKMDTTKGEISFALNGTDLGVAYKGIPLDKPLVPCVLLKNKDDSVELVT